MTIDGEFEGSHAMSKRKSAGSSAGSSAESEASVTPTRRTTPLQDVKSALKTITGEQKRITKELKKADANPELRETQEKHLEGLNTLRGRLEEQMTQIRSKLPKRKGPSAKG